MQALVFDGPRQLRLADLPEPRPAAGEVVLEVAQCCVCGSDVHGFRGHSARRNANVPLVMGHECSGRVAALGAGVTGWTVGQRAVVQPAVSCGVCPACRAGQANTCPKLALIGIERPGAFARFVAVPAHRLFAIPDGADDLTAALTETLAVEVHVVRRFLPPLARCVLVLGAGPQGLLAAQLARLAGAAQVLVSDVLDERLAWAARLGATATLRGDRDNPAAVVRSHTDGWGADVAIDVVGVAETRRQGLAALAPGGVLVEVGLGVGESALNFLPLIGRELRVQGSYAYSDDDFALALELLASGRVRGKEWLHPAPLADGARLVAQLADAPGDLVKVALAP